MEWFPLAQHHRLPAAPGVYIIRHIETGKEYVGQSLNVRKRAKSHAWADPKHYMGRAIRFHGADAFEICFWSAGAPAALGQMEIELIAARGSRVPAGYNLSDGGLGPTGTVWSDERKAAQSARVAGVPLAEETKEKMRARALSHNPFKGKTHTAETKAKMGAAAVALHTGRKRSAETCANISAATKGRPAPYVSPEARERAAEKQRGVKKPGCGHPGEANPMYGVKGGAHPRAKAVAVWAPESMVPRVYESTTEAAEGMGSSVPRVCDYLAGRRKDPRGRLVTPA